MDRHLLFELTYVFYKVCLAIIRGECWLVESSRKFCLFYPPCKGDLEIWLKAFFITSIPTPLRGELLRFLQWRCSSSQENDSLGGVLDLCLYIVSSSSLEETSKLEGDRFCCARRSCFFKSSISCCMVLSLSLSWDTFLFLWKSLPFVWMECTLPSW